MSSFKTRPLARKTLPLLVVSILALAVTLAGFFNVREKELQETRNRFFFHTQNIASHFKDIIGDEVDTLHLIHALFQSSEYVNRNEFERFVKPILKRHPRILAFGWAPFLKTEEKEKFFQKLIQEGYEPSEKTRSKSLFSGTGDGEVGFFPVHYIEGPEKKAIPVGNNIAFSDKIIEALNESSLNRTPGAAEITWPDHADSQHKVVLAFFPVFSKNHVFSAPLEKRENSLGGFVFAVFSTSAILQEVIEERALSGIEVAIDESSPFTGQQGTSWARSQVTKNLQNFEPFEIGTLRRAIHFRALPAFMADKTSWRPEFYLAAGLLATGLLLLYLHHTFKRAAHMELLAASLTREVNERKCLAEARENLVIELEAKNAELERFTYTVSHDLKSPLITIRGFSGLLAQDAEKGDKERVQADVQQIKSATDKMQRLLDELLELSRVGRLVNPFQEINLSDLIQETLGLLAGRISEAGVEIVIAPQFPAVYGDRPRLLEVFQNLIDNAVKFMGEQPSPRIDIEVQEQDRQIICFVRDNGQGIPQRYQEKIFGLFERLDQSCDGTGIGLALVKRIVEFHGGRIWVESDGEGKGATFVFTLPLKQEGDVSGKVQGN